MLTPQKKCKKLVLGVFVDKLMSPFSWSFGGSSRWNGIGRFCDDPMNKSINGANGAKAASHCSTVERLYAWEKKLYLEVKVKLTFNRLWSL